MVADKQKLDIPGKKGKTFSITWQVVVFPSLAAFFILAAYGFYLIYNLVGDVHRIADSVGINMGIMAGQMQQVSANLDELTGSVHSISVNLDDLTVRVRDMGETMTVISSNVETLPSMLTNMDDMEVSMSSIDSHMGSIDQNIGIMNGQVDSMTKLMGSMATSTHLINRNVYGVNQSIGRPMSRINKFAPW